MAGVRVEAGDRGASVGFRDGRRKLGLLHGDHAAYFSFPEDAWADLRRDDRIVPHPVFPGARGPARRIETEADIPDVIGLLRVNCELGLERQGLLEVA